MRRALALVAVLMLAGCGDPGTMEQAPSVQVGSIGVLRVHKIEVNGRLISCVVSESTSNAGVSCDFTREAAP